MSDLQDDWSSIYDSANEVFTGLRDSLSAVHMVVKNLVDVRRKPGLTGGMYSTLR